MLHGRDDERGEAALAEIFTTTGSDRLTWFRADFAELAQVRSLVERVARRFDRLDVVVSNAGIGTTVPGGDARLVSADGYELRFAVNDLAGFLLAQRLEPLLSAAPGGRFVSVSSARQGALDFNDVMLERSYSGLQAHRQSKLAQIMMTFDRAERFAASRVAAAILHPSTFMPTKTVATPTSSCRRRGSDGAPCRGFACKGNQRSLLQRLAGSSRSRVGIRSAGPQAPARIKRTPRRRLKRVRLRYCVEGFVPTATSCRASRTRASSPGRACTPISIPPAASSRS